MQLTEREKEMLLLTIAADLARRRLARGVKLNDSESIALITFEILEGARSGKTVEQLMEYDTTILKRDQLTKSSLSGLLSLAANTVRSALDASWSGRVGQSLAEER
ncbi:hypothetical protein GXP70_09635 [Paenibacillus lycopersici]|uniref:Urease subunit gamma n=1 Tax=Paenibacillus lycopersici TaxID=2704462 RepID=A0A6C0FTI8_9BACL|nr:urease subunit gamma [Paenibacillus lycopersici]QHT60177.1 hypothetical protein GXP70_09635 [Paenibacillus lycopersici]